MWGILFNIIITAAMACTTLEFVTIEPRGSSPAPKCDSESDKLACQVGRGFSHFDALTTADGHKAHRIARARASMTELTDYLAPLERSAAIREVNELRVLARKISGQVNVCEPNYIYFGGPQIFGMGPAFVSSERFLLDGSEDATTNVIMAEDATAPFHIPIAMISKTNLIENSYYELVIAHELAHGLMQDLYGVDEFAKLESRVVSRDGHMASAVTDPRLAWIEGFAEGFEAYLGEKTLDAHALATPHLDKTMSQVFDRIDDFNAYGWKGYLFTIPGTIARTFRTLLSMDDFLSDFLKAERQQAVRDNHYVLRGQFNNLSHHYGLPIATNELDADEVAGYAPESSEGVLNKEGVAAHFVYSALHAGLAPQMFEAIHTGRPRDLWEFAMEFPYFLEPAELSRMGDAYRTTFTAEGREAVSSRLHNLIDPDNRRAKGFDPARVEALYRERLSKIPLPLRIAPPHDFWVEFWNASQVHRKLYGTMDRINVATATPGRLEAFLETLDLPKPRRLRVLRALINARENLIDSGRTLSLKAFADRWAEDVAAYAGGDAQLKTDILDAVRELAAMRNCFTSSCLTHGLPRD